MKPIRARLIRPSTPWHSTPVTVALQQRINGGKPRRSVSLTFGKDAVAELSPGQATRLINEIADALEEGDSRV